QIIKAALVECANHPSASSEQINALGICYISLADFVENLSERTLRGGLHLAEELNEESRRLWAEWQSMVINNA
ncbi:MAG TPA: hypothetical protein VEZ26_00960, partial [Sphingomonadaceae bacterium]|nr:hypothetical protein [Sphingomonadaceae bacterium]